MGGETEYVNTCNYAIKSRNSIRFSLIIVNATIFFPIFLLFQNKFVSLFRDLRMADDYRDDNEQVKWRKSQDIEGKKERETLCFVL